MPRKRRKVVDEQLKNIKELIDEAPVVARITKREQELSQHYQRGRVDGIRHASEEASKMIAELRETLRQQQEMAQRAMVTATHTFASAIFMLGKEEGKNAQR